MKNILLCWGGILAVTCTGCTSVQVTGRDLYSSQPVEEEHEDQIHYSMATAQRTEEQQTKVSRAIARSDLVAGMSMAEVNSAWGEPLEVQNAGQIRHGNERWLYRTGLSSKYGLGQTRAVYFEGGRVVGWQTE